MSETERATVYVPEADQFGPWTTVVDRGAVDVKAVIVGLVIKPSRPGEYMVDFALGDPGEERRVSGWVGAAIGGVEEWFVPTAIQPNGQRVSIRVASSEAEPAELLAHAVTAEEYAANRRRAQEAVKP